MEYTKPKYIIGDIVVFKNNVTLPEQGEIKSAREIDCWNYEIKTGNKSLYNILEKDIVDCLYSKRDNQQEIRIDNVTLETIKNTIY